MGDEIQASRLGHHQTNYQCMTRHNQKSHYGRPQLRRQPTQKERQKRTIPPPPRAPPPTYPPRPPLLPQFHVIRLLLPSTTTHVVLFPQSPFSLIATTTRSHLTLWNAQQPHPIRLRRLPRKPGEFSPVLAHWSCDNTTSHLLRQIRHRDGDRRGGDSQIYLAGPSARVVLLTPRRNRNRLMKRPQARRAKTKMCRVRLVKRHRNNKPCKK
ncbi:hypothetical protein V8E53_012216 [Lactarius tabidus]